MLNPPTFIVDKDTILTMFKDYSDVVNTPELCEMLGGISSKSAYKLLKANRISHFKIGRAYKIPKVHVIAYLHSLIRSQHTEIADDFNALMH
ncbi:helix-turn-helix domain-containing protein [Paenibacillus luteus]|uniref:helix-turn-helix domain-containing protein n=1 Tax=Paenibacillus luteus TaxID=2545753 RepID=UPI001142A740|nr:helix-turn-helix domain-containing protein [Paenibacillus luteus]